MRNNTDDLYERVADLDEAIAQRRALIEEAKALAELEQNKQSTKLTN